MQTYDYISLIMDKLKGLNLLKVILFGSFANGTASKDSDIDLLVVTDDDYYPKNYDENMKIYLNIASRLREIKAKIPVDLIVHTKSMHKRFIEMDSLFSRELNKYGKVIYEKNNG